MKDIIMFFFCRFTNDKKLSKLPIDAAGRGGVHSELAPLPPRGYGGCGQNIFFFAPSCHGWLA